MDSRASSGTLSLVLLFASLPVVGCGGDFALLTLSDDEYKGASVTESWSVDVEHAPLIKVDACGGAIIVKPGAADRVEVSVTRNSLCKKKSQVHAEESLDSIEVEVDQEAHGVEVVTRRRQGEDTGCSLTTTVELRVPSDVRLDLETEVGSIWVVGSPHELRARNDLGALLFQLDEPPGDARTSADPERVEFKGFGNGELIHLRNDDGWSVESGPVQRDP
ncbi:hypothetical protein AB1L88_22430 [Tautonia sp. JC769]|uniref:hypothetical protein n=1 Tax=Tautonia sp. JC769 TaxID=3232135 RepID=UPI003458E478